MRRLFALVLLPAALALAACGGGNDSQNAKTSSTTSTAATGATGTAKQNSGGTGKAKSNAKGNAKSNAKNKATNRTGNKKTKAGTRKGAGKTKSRPGTRKQRQKPAPSNTKTTPVTKAPPQGGKLPSTDQGSYSVAKKVCGGYLEETIKGKKLTDLAKSYSHAWPSDRRQAAYDGCLAGLKQPRIPGSDEY